MVEQTFGTGGAGRGRTLAQRRGVRSGALEDRLSSCGWEALHLTTRSLRMTAFFIFMPKENDSVFCFCAEGKIEPCLLTGVRAISYFVLAFFRAWAMAVSARGTMMA